MPSGCVRETDLYKQQNSMLSRISGLREREFACRYVRYLLPNHIRFRIGSENCHWPQKTRGHIRSLVYRLFEKAMLWELIPLERNPMGLVELKGVSKRLKPPRILTFGHCSVSSTIRISVWSFWLGVPASVSAR